MNNKGCPEKTLVFYQRNSSNTLKRKLGSESSTHLRGCSVAKLLGFIESPNKKIDKAHSEEIWEKYFSWRRSNYFDEIFSSEKSSFLFRLKIENFVSFIISDQLTLDRKKTSDWETPMDEENEFPKVENWNNFGSEFKLLSQLSQLNSTQWLQNVRIKHFIRE